MKIASNRSSRWIIAALAASLFLAAGCGSKDTAGASGTGGASGGPSGKVSTDGSSTVEPIISAMAEQFRGQQPNVDVQVGTSGTGGGFKKFVNGEIDISNASRVIETAEIETAKENGHEFVELPIAFDGLSVVVNPKNDWADSLTVDELKKIWEPGSKIVNWSQVRPGFPNKKLTLYGAGTDSGTFDYFTKAIMGKEKASRSDYNASEDDNSLVIGIAGDEGALGYFGYAYLENNRDKLKPVKIAAADGAQAVEPTPETIASGEYTPLSRPLFIYVNRKSLDRPEVQEFVRFALTEGRNVLARVGYVPLPDSVYDLAVERAQSKTAGSLFGGKMSPGMSLEDLLAAERK